MYKLLLIIFGVSFATGLDIDPKPKTQRKLIIKKAESLLESRYTYGGNTPKGFDCSGFTQYVFKQAVKISLNRSANAQSKQGKTIKLKKAQKGDLIFFKSSAKINHVGIIYKKNSKSLWMIHASSSKGVILEEVLNSEYWNSRITKVKRLI